MNNSFLLIWPSFSCRQEMICSNLVTRNFSKSKVSTIIIRIPRSPYLQCDASVGFGQRRHSVLSLCGVTGQRDQVVVPIGVCDQRRCAVGLKEV